MIPILFEESTTIFTTNGLGRIADFASCKVKEERNGIYELTATYPVGGKMYKELVVGRYIFATHDESKIPQPFEIYKVSAVINGLVTINAQHISYKLNKQTVLPFTATSCANAMDKIKANILNGTDFTFWTDKSVTANYKLEVPKTVRSVLGGEENSILDIYGKGEYEFDMFAVKLHLNRGSNNHVTIRYGKNLLSLEQQRDKSSVFNAVVPYYLGEDGTLVTLPEWAVYGQSSTRQLRLITRQGDLLANGDDLLADFSEIAIVPLDLSSEFEEAPTVAQLRTKAQKYLTDNEPWVINENIKIDFVQLWQTEEYKDVAPLQRIKLCDWVYVYVPQMDITAKAECISVTYDTLNERYDEMELGKAKTTFAQVIAEVSEKNILPKVVTATNMNQAIYTATQTILGGYGGYIKYVMLGDEPSELLFMDAPEESQAIHILRLNKNGIGFSDDGGQTYHTAWTLDGKFNASFITVGSLLADLIKAGTLSDRNGVNTWDMESGSLTTKSIRITDYMYIDAGVGSYFRFPLSSTDPEHNFLEIRNQNPPFRIITQNSWGGSNTVEITQDYFMISDGDFKTTVKPNEVEIVNTLGGMSVTMSLDSFRRGLVVTDLTGESVITPTQISTTGTKNRIVDGKLYYCYETPIPYFGDIGEGVIGENGECSIPINIRQEIQMPYQVFVQAYGETPVFVYARHEDSFVVKGTAGTHFAWELKAKQFDCEVN